VLAQQVVCNSEATRRWLVDRWPQVASRTQVVPVTRQRPPRDLHAAQALRAGLGVGPEQVLVALVGRISPRKGQEVLVEAAERARAPRLVYAIAGDPPPGRAAWQAALERRLAASPRRAAFHLLGFRDDVWTLWDACDVAVVPSRRPESFGLVALEAMLAGKPVVASATGALPDLVAHERTGLLVPPNDPAALAAALERLARDRALRERLGQAGREAARAGRGAGLAARKVEALYERMLDERI
jgi:glycosyltransferase involved in cell wall biosynthesis